MDWKLLIKSIIKAIFIVGITIVSVVYIIILLSKIPSDLVGIAIIILCFTVVIGITACGYYVKEKRRRGERK